ncbi:MAG: heavy-metal-associated domain-containing protein [Planctomycetes bacterium]|nr:heavy-metal-associated domain-containing protein [Planctomycetota bacterium]
MTQTKLSVPDMTCGHCKASIESALRSLGGVDCEVDLDEREVVVRYDAAQRPLAGIVAAIEAQGFDVAAADGAPVPRAEG